MTDAKLTVSLGKKDQEANNPKIVMDKSNNWNTDKVGEPEESQYVDNTKLVISDGDAGTNLDEEIRLLELELKEQEQ